MTIDEHSDASCVALWPADRPGFDQDELQVFLTSLSHDLGRRLISLRAGFDLLLGNARCPMPAEQRGHVQTMVRLCDDLLGLTRNYLDYAGLLEGARPLCYGTFTIGALIREIDRQFAAHAASRRIAWECSIEGPEATVTTDASRCLQVFGNLVANALKFTPEGGQIRLKGGREGDHWCVVISDTGPGIPRESLGRVFEPFFRIPRNEPATCEGNGLGLAICREMVGQMGGEIVLDSAVGRGTSARVRLPANGVARLPA